jgi:hypothetical protein
LSRISPHNITRFYSSRHGSVELIKCSVGKYTYEGLLKVPQGPGMPDLVEYKTITYWHGQLVNAWSGSVGHESWSFHKGQVIWLDCAVFDKVFDQEWLNYTNT